MRNDTFINSIFAESRFTEINRDFGIPDEDIANPVETAIGKTRNSISRSNRHDARPGSRSPRQDR